MQVLILQHISSNTYCAIVRVLYFMTRLILMFKVYIPESYISTLWVNIYIWHHTVAGRNPANQLRLVVYPIISRVSYIPGGCLGFLNHQQYQQTSLHQDQWQHPSPIRSKTTKEGKASHLLALKIGRRRRHLRDKNRYVFTQMEYYEGFYQLKILYTGITPLKIWKGVFLLKKMWWNYCPLVN